MTSLVLNTDKRLFYLFSVLMVCKASLLTFVARTNPCFDLSISRFIMQKIPAPGTTFILSQWFLFIPRNIVELGSLRCKCLCMFFSALHPHEGQHSGAVVVRLICMFSHACACAGFFWELHFPPADYNHIHRMIGGL